MKLLEQKFITDTQNLFYNKNELKEHEEFMTKYIFKLDKLDKSSINTFDFGIFSEKYNLLSDNVKENLKDIYIEYRILVFKNKIEDIVKWKNNVFGYNHLKTPINELYKMIWEEELDKFLESIKNKKD